MSLVTYGFSRRASGVQQVVTGPTATVNEETFTIIIEATGLTVTATSGQFIVNQGST